MNDENKDTAETPIGEKPTKAEKKEIAKLNEELEKTKAELAALNDKYLRMIAEYDNFRQALRQGTRRRVCRCLW